MRFASSVRRILQASSVHRTLQEGDVQFDFYGLTGAFKELERQRTDAEEQLIESADLAPNLVGALRGTFAPA